MALVTGIAATTAAVMDHPYAGVYIEAGLVEDVSRTGFAWRDGVRPGQPVLWLNASDDEGGWALAVAGPRGPIITREPPEVETLRATLVFGLAAMAAACLAIGFLRLNRLWSLPSASFALFCGSIPLFVANHSAAGFVMALAAAVPAAGLVIRIGRYRAIAIVTAIASSVVVVAWFVAFEQGITVDNLEAARQGLALGGTGILMADRAFQRRPSPPSRGEALWLALGAIVVGGGLVVMYFLTVPAPVVLLVLGILAIRPLRSIVGRRLELALMSDLRHQVAADVAEEERGRLARELHDSPLQELSAVIRRLEQVPGAQVEAASLQSIADQLRSVAVDLRPPMLDDIGLGAAIDFLAEQVSTPGTPVVPELVDGTGLERERRPPAAVEFAVYRIVREAVANALHHAQAKSITIAGRIAPDAIDLSVEDDGVGIAREARSRASGRGRLGLASMRRRAQAIGAELTIEPREGPTGGTRMTVRWRD